MTVQLVVTYNDHTIMYYSVNMRQGWRVDAAKRCIVIGRRLPRTYIPLDSIRSWDVEQLPERMHDELADLQPAPGHDGPPAGRD